MEHVKLKVSEILMGKILEKDLQDNEQICPTCKGLGIISYDFNFYKYEDISNNIKLQSYNNMHFGPCPMCYNGVVKVCKYCGSIITKSQLKCDCEGQKAEDEKEYNEKLQNTIANATEVFDNENMWLTDDKGFNYYRTIDDFIDEFIYEYFEESHNYIDFNDFFEKEVPERLWLCKTYRISLNAYDIISEACENLHEDAMENIMTEDIQKLQNYLDKWCDNQYGTETSYTDYEKYITVKKDWFTERSE